VILVKKDFNAEIRNLQKLREGLRVHKRIVTNIAAVVIENEFNLFFDLAKTDLNTFLYGLKDPASLKDPVKLKKLIVEAVNLVDALYFLHDDLSSEWGDGGTAQKVCYHADLKPENILVYERPEDPNDVVGRWKIADFGISRIEDRPDGESTALGANMTMLVEQRVRGIYTAPESDAGRLSDIWSFGCIFHQILAAGLGGGPLIKKLDDERSKITDDGSSIRSPSFYKREEKGTKAVLKSCAKTWVENELPNHPRGLEGGVAMQECSKLLMEMLRIDKSQRPNARKVRTWLNHIIEGRAMPALTPATSKSNGEPTTSDPVGGSTTSGPIGETAALEPPRMSTASDSVGEPAAPEPPKASTASQPVGRTAIPEPPKTSTASQPVGGTAAPEPPRTSTASGPVGGTAAVEPPRRPTASIHSRGSEGPLDVPASTPPPPLSPGLISAIESTNPTTVYALMKKGDKVLARDSDGRCALHHAARVGGRRVLLQLLKSKELKGDNINGINQQDNSGATPLHQAASGTKREIVAELIKAGADKNAKDNDWRTPLHYAALRARREIGFELIEAGADKDAKDRFGRTPLYAASLDSSEAHTDFVEFLLDSGAIETPNLPPEFKTKKNYIHYRKRKRR
jgi:serine/threonine protein kinase